MDMDWLHSFRFWIFSEMFLWTRNWIITCSPLSERGLLLRGTASKVQWGIHIFSWFCNFAIGIPHHNIMDKRKEELRIPEDLTVREERYITGHTSSGCARSFAFACCQGEEWVCFQAMRLHQVSLSVSETFSLILFDLLRLLSIRLYYIVPSCIPIP